MLYNLNKKEVDLIKNWVNVHMTDKDFSNKVEQDDYIYLLSQLEYKLNKREED